MSTAIWLAMGSHLAPSPYFHLYSLFVLYRSIPMKNFFDWMVLALVVTVLVLAIMLALFGCSFTPIRHITTERYSQLEVREFRMALAYVARELPNLDTSQVKLDAVNIYPVRKAEFRCVLYDVHGCYVPGEGRDFGIWYSSLYDEREVRYILRHEFVHYILYTVGYEDWANHHLSWRWHDVNHIMLKRDW